MYTKKEKSHKLIIQNKDNPACCVVMFSYMTQIKCERPLVTCLRVVTRGKC